METNTEKEQEEKVNTPNNETNNETKPEGIFKKPVLIGKIGRLPRKIIHPIKPFRENISDDVKITDKENHSELILNKSEQLDTSLEEEEEEEDDEEEEEKEECEKPTVPYKEPIWSGLPSTTSQLYNFEVLKSGVIVEQINLMMKPYWVFGRVPICDIYMMNPTISRFHAVLQYRKEGVEGNPAGFYIYDLGSTHGTFLNKARLKPRVYAPVKVGHMIKLGFSTRCYVLTGPEDDMEEESKFTVTELRQQTAEKMLRLEMEQKAALAQKAKDEEEKRKKEEERSIDWGLGEDADETTDLAENPYAQPNNEELYIDDPKKALRGFMEREGYDLDYDCKEQGFGQFLCKVELPVDDDNGRPIVAEVLHKGKKKEAVVQCALEACRILDRYGLLRRATHESRKRKAKDWEENDYYDSDDDTYLDRTGSIESKREKRMQAKGSQQPETYQSLLEEEKKLTRRMNYLNQQLNHAKFRNVRKPVSSTKEDSLDLYMKELKQPKLDRDALIKAKAEISQLQLQHLKLVKLINAVKPAELPPLLSEVESKKKEEKKRSPKTSLPIFGKRLKVKVNLSPKPKKEETFVSSADEDAEEEKDETEAASSSAPSAKEPTQLTDSPSRNQLKNENAVPKTIWHKRITHRINRLEELFAEYPEELRLQIKEVCELLEKLKDCMEYDDRLFMDTKTILAKNRKMKLYLNNLMKSYDEQKFKRVSKVAERLTQELSELNEKQEGVTNDVAVLDAKIRSLCKEISDLIDKLKNEEMEKANNENAEMKCLEDDGNDKDDLTPEELEKRKKKNQKRLVHRRERAEIEKQKGYQEDARKEDYNMWVPPKDQTGDGRTNLNEKYGY